MNLLHLLHDIKGCRPAPDPWNVSRMKLTLCIYIYNHDHIYDMYMYEVIESHMICIHTLETLETR
jgi:hypothetical protein